MILGGVRRMITFTKSGGRKKKLSEEEEEEATLIEDYHKQLDSVVHAG